CPWPAARPSVHRPPPWSRARTSSSAPRGRVRDHLQRGTLKLDRLNCLVLDEADRMLDMGFIEVISEIIECTPSRRQTLLFSATYPPGIEGLAGRFMRNPQQVVIEETEV